MKMKLKVITTICVCGLSAYAQILGEPDYYLSFPKGEEREARMREDIRAGKLRVPFPTGPQGDGHVAIVLDDWTHRPREKMDEAIKALTVQDIPVFVQTLRFHEWLSETLEKTPSFPTSKFEMMMLHVVNLDGHDTCSVGNPDILDYTRKYFRGFKENRGASERATSAAAYLALKGSADDCALLENILPDILYDTRDKQSISDSLGVLNARASGTNLLEGMVTGISSWNPYWSTNLPPFNPSVASRTNWLDKWGGKDYHGWSTNSPPFIPSVANTGPQAAHVHDLLKQALEKYGSVSNIPPELITMVVSFDEDGNPVCNVDLAKYGLTMPDIEAPITDDYVLPDSDATTKEEQLPNEPAETKSTPWKILLLVGVLVGIGIVAAIAQRTPNG